MSEEKFKTRLEIAKKKATNKIYKKDENKSSMLGIAFKMSTELVAAVLIGSIIGFIFDSWFGTKPWLILIFFFYRSYSWNTKCYKIRKKNAKVRYYGYKSNASIQCLQNWS